MLAGFRLGFVCILRYGCDVVARHRSPVPPLVFRRACDPNNMQQIKQSGPPRRNMASGRILHARREKRSVFPNQVKSGATDFACSFGTARWFAWVAGYRASGAVRPVCCTVTGNPTVGGCLRSRGTAMKEMPSLDEMIIALWEPSGGSATYPSPEASSISSFPI